MSAPKLDTSSCPIVYVSPYFVAKQTSGANRRFNEVCKRFSDEFGERFHLIVAKGEKPDWWNGTHLLEVDYRFNHPSKFTAAAEIGRYLDTLPPSLVIIESLPIPFRSLKRHRHFQVAYDFRYFRKESKGLLYRLMFSQYLKDQWRRSEYMVTCSEFSIHELERYVAYPRNRIIKSFFGIDERVFGVPKENKVYDLIYVGHFEKRKNHAPLLHAIAKVNPAMKVVLIGQDNGLRSSLEALAKELGLTNVVFDAINDDAKLWKLYQESRVFAFPSIYEGFGMPLIEAMALGLPVLASDMEVFREVGGDLATYFNPTNPDDIAAKLTDALAHPVVPSPENVRTHLTPFLWDEIYKNFVKDLFARA